MSGLLLLLATTTVSGPLSSAAYQSYSRARCKGPLRDLVTQRLAQAFCCLAFNWLAKAGDASVIIRNTAIVLLTMSQTRNAHLVGFGKMPTSQ